MNVVQGVMCYSVSIPDIINIILAQDGSNRPVPAPRRKSGGSIYNNKSANSLPVLLKDFSADSSSGRMMMSAHSAPSYPVPHTLISSGLSQGTENF